MLHWFDAIIRVTKKQVCGALVPQTCLIGEYAMKKLLSCLLAGALAVQGSQMIGSAADTGRIQIGSASVAAGETFELPVVIEQNPGVAALSLNLTYDASKLELLGAEDGKILGSSVFLAGNDLTLIPYTMNWDDLAADNNTGTGTVAVLKFAAKANAAGDAAVSVAGNQRSTFNVDLEEVAFETVGGVVSIAADENAPAILADTVSASAGDTVSVPLRIQNNPGIAALSLQISYDASKLKLLGAEDGKILGSSVFLAGNDLTQIPYTLNWDDLSSENNTGNGIVAVLQFEVLAEEGDAEIAVTVNQRSTFNVDLEEVAFAAVNGKVRIRNSGETVSGDMNGDGMLTMADTVLLARFTAEDDTLTAEQIAGILQAEPDRDSSGIVNYTDVYALLNQVTEQI